VTLVDSVIVADSGKAAVVELGEEVVFDSGKEVGMGTSSRTVVGMGCTDGAGVGMGCTDGAGAGVAGQSGVKNCQKHSLLSPFRPTGLQDLMVGRLDLRPQMAS